MSKNTVTVDASGFEKIEADLRRFAPMIVGQKGYPKNALRNAARAMAKDALKDAQQRVPVDTGRLRESLKIKLLSTKYRDPSILAGNSKEYYYLGYDRGKNRDDPKGAFYGWMVENGTDRMPARPFMRPAVVGRQGMLRAEFEGKITRDLDNIARKIDARSRARMKGRA